MGLRFVCFFNAIFPCFLKTKTKSAVSDVSPGLHTEAPAVSTAEDPHLPWPEKLAGDADTIERRSRGAGSAVGVRVVVLFYCVFFNQRSWMVLVGFVKRFLIILILFSFALKFQTNVAGLVLRCFVFYSICTARS